MAIRTGASVEGFVALTLYFSAACSPSHRDVPCPKNQPAFRFQVTAVDGPLPPDTSLTVTYSGSESETYSLLKGGPKNQDVCCRAGDPTTGKLPDVRCGGAIPIEASTAPHPKRDASAVIGDANPPKSEAPNMDAAMPRDASVTDGAMLHDASVIDAAMSPGASIMDAAIAHDGAMELPGVHAILCDLWTGGSSFVEVTANTYVSLMAPLTAEVDDPNCGVTTVDVRRTLFHKDAGPPE